MRKTPWSALGTMDPALKQALREKRAEGGLTQEEAAHAAEMSSTSRWSDLERPHGRAKPLSLLEIQRAAEAVGGEPVAIVRRAMEIKEAEE